MDEELKAMLIDAKSKGAKDSDLNRLIELYQSDLSKKKVPTTPSKSISNTPMEKLESNGETTSLGGVEPNGFPAVDTNSIAPDFDKMKPAVAVEKSKSTLRPITDLQVKTKEPSLLDKATKKIGSLTNKFLTGTSQLGADIASTPEILYDTFSAPQNAIADILDLPSLKTDSEKFKKNVGITNGVKDFYKGEVSKLREHAQQVDNKYKDGIFDSFVNGDYAGGFDQLTNSFAESLPATASIMVGGAAMKAPQLIAASSTLFGAGKNEQLKDENPEMDTNTRVVNSLVTGLIQGATESLGTGSIGAAAKGIAQREGAKKAVTILKDGLTTYYKAALKKNPLLASMTGEGLEEAFQGVAENAVDVATGVKPEDFNIYGSMADDFIGGAFAGTVFGGGLKGLENVANIQEQQKVKNNFKKTFELQKQLENPNISDPVKAEIEKNIDILVKNNKEIVNRSVKQMDELNPKIQEKLKEVVFRNEEIKNKTKEIKFDSGISDASKKIMLDNLKQEYESNIKTKNSILENKTTVIDVLPVKEQDRLKREALKELKQELNPDGKKDMVIDDKQITEKANKNYAKLEKEAPITNEGNISKTELKEDVVVPEKQDTKVENTPLVEESFTEEINPEKEISLSEKTKEPNDIDYTKEQINSGILNWDGNINSPRIDLGLSWADIRKGQADLQKGNQNTVPAKRLIEAINKAKEEGGYRYKYGTGTENARATEFVSFENMQKTKNEYELTDSEQKEISDNEIELAKEYDQYFNSLTPEEQIEILDDYENRQDITGTVEGNEPIGKSKENVSNEKTTDRESTQKEIILEDNRREKSSEEKAKDLDITHKQYLDFKDKIEKVPESGEFGKYLSGETMEMVWEEAPTNNQTYQKKKLIDAAQHGEKVLEYAKESFGDNYIKKTLDYLQSANINAFEKGVVYAALENNIDTAVKENPNNKNLKMLRELINSDSQANLNNASGGINTGRLRRIYNAIKNGIDIEEITDQMLTTKQKEAKNILRNAVPNGENLNKITQEEAKEFTKEEFESKLNEELEKAEKEWKRSNLGFEIRQSKIKIRKEDALVQIKKIKEEWRKASKDGTLSVSLPYAKQLIAVTPDIIKLANIYRQIAGMKTIDIVEAIKNDISEIFESITERDVKAILKKEFGDNSAKQIKIKISDVAKKALIEAGFYREIKIKGEPRKVLDWVKLTGRMSSINSLKENIEPQLKKQGYDKAKIKEISKELKDEYKRLSSEIVDRATADLERRNLIKPSPNRKSENQRLAELNNEGLFGDNIKKYENVVNRILGFSDIDQKTYNEIKKKVNALSELYSKKSDGKPLTDLALESQASKINKDISDLLAISAFKKGPIHYKIVKVIEQVGYLGQKTLLSSLPALIENITSGHLARLTQKYSIGVKKHLTGAGKYSTKELDKQIEKNAEAIKSDINANAGLDYGPVSTSLVSNSLIEDITNKKLSSKSAHTAMTLATMRRFLNAADSYVKYKMTEYLFIKNAVKILTSKTNPNGAMTKDEAIQFISESLTGDSFDKALKTAKDIIDEINKSEPEKQIKDNPESIHRFAMDIVRQNLTNDNKMTMEQIEKAFKASYKGAGSDIGHEANNPMAIMSQHLSQHLSKEINDAVREQKWTKATLNSLALLIHKTIVNPFAAGGSNWVVLTLERGVPVLGSISTLVNNAKKEDLDLSTDTGVKNLEKSLYYEYKTKASVARNLISTGLAISAYLIGSYKGDDDESNIEEFTQWLNENEWAKKSFYKLAPTAFVIMVAIENGQLGKELARLLGFKDEQFNQSVKVVKALDSEEEGKLSGETGKLIGTVFQSPVAWKYTKDAVNVWRGIRGLPALETDYQVKGFLNGFFQGGLTETVGLRPDASEDEDIEENMPTLKR